MNQGANAAYLLLCLVLVGSGLAARRLPLGHTLKVAAAWIAIFALAFAVFAFRNEFSAFGQRLKQEAFGNSAPASGQGGTVVIRRQDDGHYWVDASINGQSARFLIDSGASKTTIDRDLARRAGIEMGIALDVVDTANGTVAMHKGVADRLEIGAIVRSDWPISVSDQPGLAVIGMDVLSSLRGWRVDGDRLVLQP